MYSILPPKNKLILRNKKTGVEPVLNYIIIFMATTIIIY